MAAAFPGRTLHIGGARLRQTKFHRLPTDTADAKGALDRIAIPQEALDEIGAIAPRSGEPQGGTAGRSRGRVQFRAPMRMAIAIRQSFHLVSPLFSTRPTIRPPTIDELSGLSDLCFRSKAVWGYDEKFMEACRSELSFEPRDLELTSIVVAEHDGKSIGVAQLKVVDDVADLLKLFVEPSALRGGTGKALLTWATDVAKRLGATRLTIEADPDAAPFYRRMGAYDVGHAPSGSVPGRMLPKLAMDLCPRGNSADTRRPEPAHQVVSVGPLLAG